MNKGFSNNIVHQCHLMKKAWEEVYDERRPRSDPRTKFSDSLTIIVDGVWLPKD